MGWSDIPDLENSPTPWADNPWVGHRTQPVGNVSVLLPPEDWLCKKLEYLNLILIKGINPRARGSSHGPVFVYTKVPESVEYPPD